jgi:hypothetical protein
MQMPTPSFPWALALLLVARLPALAGDDEAARTKQDLDALRAYLTREYPGKKWQHGPARLDSPALRAAYGGRRFYHVYSSPPLPPGANLKSVQEGHRRRVEEIRKSYVALVVHIDAKGRVVPVRQPQDNSDDLMKVTGDADARTAAAAILSLYLCDHVPPAAVDPGTVAVTPSKPVVRHLTGEPPCYPFVTCSRRTGR